MKEKQLTAVEWLVHQLGLNCTTDHEDEIHEALEMEKEQIMDAALELNPGNIPPKLVKELAEKYYNETFKQQEQ